MLTSTLRFNYQGLPETLAAQVRHTLRDPYNRPVALREGLVGHHCVCRCCLRRINLNESAIIFSHNPFQFFTPFAEQGPVVIHAEACGRASQANEIPAALRGLRLSVRGYSELQELTGAALALDDDLETALEHVFAHADTAWAHVRTAEAGCYLMRVQPVEN
jgi:hypothetical protein